MKTIRAILIEDEPQTRKLLRSLLLDFCEGVEVVAEAANVKEGVAAINQHKPDLVFLDIEMPRESGFKLYTYFDKIDFEIVFTTAYNKYAIRAIKLAALDYLMKPIDIDELMETLNRFREKQKTEQSSSLQHEIIENNLQNKEKEKIALPCSDGYIFVDIHDIIRCQSNKSYTLFVLADEREIWISKNLGNYAPLLEQYGFKRVHRSHLINPKFVQRFVRGKHPVLVMKDGAKITIAPNKRDSLMNDFFIP
ncbi:MAG: response regulator [Saprospiraceae bacterium]|nr:response regulator [Saprospiraceae bacterium]